MYHLTPWEERIWIEQKLRPDIPAYSETFHFKITGPLKTKKLKLVYKNLCGTHQNLNVNFFENMASVKKSIQNNYQHSLRYIDLENNSEMLSSLLEAERNWVFNLANGPLIRAVLIKLSVKSFILSITWHHIVMDGVSGELFFQQLVELYNTHKKLAIISNSALSESDTLIDKKKHALTEDYWINRLSGITPQNYLPENLLSSNDLNLSYRYTLSCSKKLTHKIDFFCKQYGCSLFQFIFAVHAILLYRYSGQNEVHMAYSVSMRSRGDKSTLGCHVNALPFLVNISGEETFLSFLKKVNLLRLSDREYQDFPFQDLLNTLRKCGVKNVEKIPDYLLNHMTYSSYNLKLDELHVELMPVEKNYAKNKWTFLFDRFETLRLEVEYSLNHFDKKFVLCFIKQFIRLATLLCDAPRIALRDLNILTPYDEKLLSSFNQTQHSLTKNKTIVDYIESSAKKYVSKIALLDDSAGLTYEQLLVQANVIADNLVQLLPEKSIIAIFLPRSNMFVISALGVLKAGHAYLPIDTSLPKQLIRQYLEVSGARYIITNNESSAIFQALKIDVLSIDNLYWNRSKASINFSVAHHPSYVIFTSGTTALPKGVVNYHSGTLNRLLWMKDCLKLNEDSRFVFKTAYSFDVSVWEIFLPLMLGATLNILPDDFHRYPDKIEKIIFDKKITVAHFVPSMLSVFLDYADSAYLRSLKILVCSGESLDRKVVEKAHKIKGCKVYNFYGPTEASIDVTAYLCSRGNLPTLIPIGKPVWNTNIFILDEEKRVVPLGVYGELYIIGDQLAGGYVNNPAATARSFITINIFNKTYQAYKTGDIAFWSHDGYLHFVGRKDRQVKLHGQRLELDGIQSMIQSLDYVKDCRIFFKQPESIDQFLYAYVILQKNVHMSKEEFLDNLRLFMPESFVPTQLIFLKSFPMLASGKVDMKALREISTAENFSRTKVLGNINNELISIYSKYVKKLPSIEDNFFFCGGTSLLLINMLFEINKSFNVKIPVHEFYENPTLLFLSLLIKKYAVFNENITFKDQNLKELTTQQRSLLYLREIATDSAFYSMPRLYILTGDLEVNRLNEAFNKILNVNEVFSVYFHKEHGEYEQRYSINPHENILVFQDFTEKKDAENSALKFVQKDAKMPINIFKAPLSRFFLIKLSHKSYLLYLNFHHLICDGWSISCFLEDLSSLYNNKDFIKKSSYYEYLKKQANDVAKNRASQKFWQKVITNVNANTCLRFPYLKADHYDHLLFNGELYEKTITNKFAFNLQQISKMAGASEFTCLLNAFFILINKYTSQTDIIVGTTISNRFSIFDSGVLGMLANTIPVPFKLNVKESILANIKFLSARLKSCMKFQNFGFDNIVKQLKEERLCLRNPMFQVAFVYLDREEDNLKLHGIHSNQQYIDNKTSKFDMTIYYLLRKGKRRLVVEYNKDLLSFEFIKEFSRHYISLLESHGDICEKPVEFFNPLASSNLDTLQAYYLNGVSKKQYFTEPVHLKNIHGVNANFACFNIDNNPEYENKFIFQKFFSRVVAVDTQIINANTPTLRVYLSYLTHKFSAFHELFGYRQPDGDIFVFYTPRRFYEVATASYKEYINTWEHVYDEIYGDIADFSRDRFHGWVSAFDSKPFLQSEMEAWLSSVTNNIAQESFSKIIEIGCGNGLLASFFSQRTIKYHGVDSSIKSIKLVSSQYTKKTHMSFEYKAAHEVNFNVIDFDYIVMNSVVQYFPNLDYLILVLQKIFDSVVEEAVIFLGDIRDYDLYSEYCDKLYGKKYHDTACFFTNNEKELLVSQRFFELLKQHPAVKDVRILKKSKDVPEELSKYRYDVLMKVSPDGKINKNISILDFYRKLDLQNQNISTDPFLSDYWVGRCRKQLLSLLGGADRACYFYNAENFDLKFYEYRAINNSIEKINDFRQLGPHSEIHTATQLKMISIWKNLLSVPIEDITADFFSLGGHSILVIKLLNEIKEHFDVKILASDFLHYNTVKKLADFVDKKHSQTMEGSLLEDKVTVRFDSSSHKKKLFFIHPLGGTLFCYADLIKQLLSRFSCIGFQDPMIILKNIHFDSISQMAKYYTDLILENQSEEKFYVVGYSSGGNIACKVCQELKRRGFSTTLFLIDSQAQPSAPAHTKKDFLVFLLSQDKNLLPDSFASEKELWLSLFVKRMKQIINFKPTAFDADVVLFKATSAEILLELDNGWQKFFGKNLRVFDIAGDHYSILSYKNSETIAKLLCAICGFE